jgi:hypothetical protein
MRQPSGQIVHKMICRASVTAADKPGRHKFRVRVERNPCPNTADAGLIPHFFRQVFVFGVTERPDFIALDALAIQVAENLILIPRAGISKFNQKLLNRAAVRASHPRGGTERIALNQTSNHADFFCFA